MVTDPQSPIRAAIWSLRGEGEDYGRIKLSRTWLNMHWADKPSHPGDLVIFNKVRDLMDARLKRENDVTAAELEAMLSQIMSPELLKQPEWPEDD